MKSISWHRISAFGEFITWFGSSYTLALLTQLFPPFTIFYGGAFIFSLAIIAIDFEENQAESFLRGLAIVGSLIGLYEFFILEPELTVGAIAIVIFLVIAMVYFKWRKSRDNT